MRARLHASCPVLLGVIGTRPFAKLSIRCAAAEIEAQAAAEEALTETRSTELISELLSKLRSFILGVSSVDVAEDLLQKVFLRIHENLTALRDQVVRAKSLAVQVARSSRNLTKDQ